jgi:hypothetical protein
MQRSRRATPSEPSDHSSTPASRSCTAAPGADCTTAPQRCPRWSTGGQARDPSSGAAGLEALEAAVARVPTVDAHARRPQQRVHVHRAGDRRPRICIAQLPNDQLRDRLEVIARSSVTEARFALVRQRAARADSSSRPLAGSPGRSSSASRRREVIAAPNWEASARAGAVTHSGLRRPRARPRRSRRPRAPSVDDRQHLVSAVDALISERCVHAWLMSEERCTASSGARTFSRHVRPPDRRPHETTRRADRALHDAATRRAVPLGAVSCRSASRSSAVPPSRSGFRMAMRSFLRRRSPTTRPHRR